MIDRSGGSDSSEGGLGPEIAGLARLLVTAPFYLTGLATMATRTLRARFRGRAVARGLREFVRSSKVPPV